MRRSIQLDFEPHWAARTWGGRRAGAGRPRGPRPTVYHVRREPLPGQCPAHVTLRVRSGIPSLRKHSFVRLFSASLREACERGEFRVAHYSIQRDHVHLIVEAAGKQALGRGMKSVAARLARAINRLWHRSGPALLGRYHVRALRTPKEVRNAIAYVLLNARKHWRQRFGQAPPVRIDEASSGYWFGGWKPGIQPSVLPDPPAVASPRTWLLRLGWRRHGLIDPAEVPGAPASRSG